MSPTLRALSSLSLAGLLSCFCLLAACGEDSQQGKEGGLLVPDEEQERLWGSVSDQSDNNSVAEQTPDQNTPDPETPAPEEDTGPPPTGDQNPWDVLERPDCAQGGVLWEQGTQECGSEVETEQLRLLNKDRTDNGLNPLRCHKGLLDTARRHSEDMSRRDYFDHLTPEGLRPWDRMDQNGVCGWRMAGENIAAGQRTPVQVQEDWMNSPGHRANILTGEFTHVGVGVYNLNGRIYWTQLFATF